MTIVPVAGCLAALLAFALTPLARALGMRVGALDRPGGRKSHDGAVPRLGGLGVGLAFAGTLGLASAVAASGVPGIGLALGYVAPLVLLTLGMLALGLVDDLRGLRAGAKLVGEIALAATAWASGFAIRTVTVPGVGTLELGAASLPVTLLWCVGLTNAINLIDGVDALGAGVAFFSAATAAAVAAHAGDAGTALVFAAIAGASLGFLPHNRPPARVFLGDSGALFLGFALALAAAGGSRKAETAFSLAASGLALGLPIMDTTLAFLRRAGRRARDATARSSVRPVRRLASVMEADADHIHHRLLRSGLTRRQAVGLLYAVCGALGLAALACAASGGRTGGSVLLYAAVLSVAGVRVLARWGRTRKAPRRQGLDAARDRSLLLLHPDPEVRSSLRREARAVGFSPVEVETSKEAVALARERTFDLVVAGADGEPGGAPAVVGILRAAYPNAVLVSVMELEDLEVGIEALERGAYDVIDMPPNPARTRLVLARTLERASLASRVRLALSLLWITLLTVPVLAYAISVLR